MIAETRSSISRCCSRCPLRCTCLSSPKSLFNTEDGWKTQDGGTTKSKKCRARPGMHSLVQGLILLQAVNTFGGWEVRRLCKIVCFQRSWLEKSFAVLEREIRLSLIIDEAEATTTARAARMTQISSNEETVALHALHERFSFLSISQPFNARPEMICYIIA